MFILKNLKWYNEFNYYIYILLSSNIFYIAIIEMAHPCDLWIIADFFPKCICCPLHKTWTFSRPTKFDCLSIFCQGWCWIVFQTTHKGHRVIILIPCGLCSLLVVHVLNQLCLFCWNVHEVELYSIQLSFGFVHINAIFLYFTWQ